MKNLEKFQKQSKQIQFWVMISSFFQYFYDLTGPKYAEKYEDSESGLKNIHFLTKTPQKHDLIVKVWSFFGYFLRQPFFGHWWGAKKNLSSLIAYENVS